MKGHQTHPLLFPIILVTMNGTSTQNIAQRNASLLLAMAYLKTRAESCLSSLSDIQAFKHHKRRSDGLVASTCTLGFDDNILFNSFTILCLYRLIEYLSCMIFEEIVSHSYESVFPVLHIHIKSLQVMKMCIEQEG